MKAADPFYKSTRWKKLRERILRRDHYQCQESKRYGRLRQADTVHHIFPLSAFPEYAWEEWNLISLSASEHDSMHTRRGDQLSEKGMELLRRTARARGMKVEDIIDGREQGTMEQRGAADAGMV